MSKPLDEQYLTWLYARIGNVKFRDPAKTKWNLMRQLFTKEFVWIVPNDDNRVEDGRDLRYRFLEENGIDRVDADWMGLGCSFLELLLGLAKRLEFEGDRTERAWFWELLSNVGIDQYVDKQYEDDRSAAKQVDEVMDRIVWRTYEYDGSGGLFPLDEPQHDQREVELWYQLSAYLLE